MGKFVSCDPRRNIRVFPSSQELAESVANDFQRAALYADSAGNIFSVALSGGLAPITLFKRLASPEISANIPWDTIHLYWGDERCVPPDHSESNFAMARQTLLDRISIPPENIHRIRGEADPETEASRYAAEIRKFLGSDGIPRFDWILLGMGQDGHTASIFPEGIFREEPTGVCCVTVHPETGQKRISLTIKTINRATQAFFLVTGSSKAEMAAKILNRLPGHEKYPAAQIEPENGSLNWLLDQAAASAWRI